MTPLTCLNLSLPPHLREAFTAIYFAGALPVNTAPTGIFLLPVIEMFRLSAPGTDGFEINGQTFWVAIAWRLDDLKGIYKGINGKTNPAINGTCIQCTVQGIKIPQLSTTGWISAVTHLDPEDPLREQFKQTYAEEPVVADIGSCEPPKKMTKASAYASARRAEQGIKGVPLSEAQQALEPYRGFNVFTTFL